MAKKIQSYVVLKLNCKDLNVSQARQDLAVSRAVKEKLKEMQSLELEAEVISTKQPITYDEFREICKRAGELAVMKLPELRNLFLDSPNLSAAKIAEETKGVTVEEMVKSILLAEYGSKAI